ncbi:MAG TPA: hypothetical protein VGI43_12550 [Mucilaginibacter sp.]|jgi:hypothetical protein
MVMEIDVKWKTILVTSFLLTIGFQTSWAQQKFDRSIFYQVMASGDTAAINSEINIIAKSPLNNKEGFEGALLMKKAGLITKPKEKLRLFKSGMLKMEMALLADSVNTEFHFLRLVIEEQAPKIVKYNTHLEKDKLFIQNNFKNALPVVQHAILDYCKRSKVLHIEDF